MGKQQTLKLFLVLTLCTAFIFSFSQFGVSAYYSMMNKSDVFAEGTTVGGIDISGKTNSEAISMLNEEVGKWLNEKQITLHYKEKSSNLPNDVITFFIEDSIEQAEQGVNNNVMTKINALEPLIGKLSPAISLEHLDFDRMKADILNDAEMLHMESVYIQISDYMLNAKDESDRLIHEVTVETTIDGLDRKLMMDKFSEIIIEPKSEVSLISLVREKEVDQISTKTLNVLATSFYESILPTNFLIVERHISKQLPDYAKLGFEAMIHIDKNMDLKIVNPNNEQYKVQIKWENDRLTTSLKGPSFLQKYKMKLKEEETLKSKVIVQFSPRLTLGQKIVETQGKAGSFTKVYREIYSEKGKLLTSELISEDFYPPIHKVEVHPLILKEEVTEETAETDNESDIEEEEEDSSIPDNEQDTSENDDSSENPE